MKCLVVYYSFEGNTRFIAETVARVSGADILELKPVKEIASHGFMKYVWGGRQAVMKSRPALIPSHIDPEKYDLIFFGSPVWAFTFAPPFNSFFAENILHDKKAAFFCCHEGGLGKTFVNFRKALDANKILGQQDFFAPLKSDKETAGKNAAEWARDILSAAGE